MVRVDGRKPDELRKILIVKNYIKHAEGSVLIEAGDTKVICTASLEDRTPPFLRGSGSGWVTAEYGMLPRSTGSRNAREAVRGRMGGRTHEISRLIGRSLRAVLDLAALGERSLLIDCDVIQADGGTRTASITGAFVALSDAIKKMRDKRIIPGNPLKDFVAAVSVGMVDGRPVLDLNYHEDSRAEVDMNVVMTGDGRFVEIQGTAEVAPFSRVQVDEMLDLAEQGIHRLITMQKEVQIQP